MIKTAIYGFGNIGRYVFDALIGDGEFALAGIVSQSFQEDSFRETPVVRRVEELGGVDAAILCLGSRDVPAAAKALLSQGISTVDSFDIHGQIPALRRELDAVAKRHGASAIISAGWDPGTDSVICALLEAMAPSGITCTNFGPGTSMGHSVAARAIPGVKDALSVTIPLGTSMHRRSVYVELEEGASLSEVTAALKADAYFAADETRVIHVACVSALRDFGHGVDLVRKGVSGQTHNQNFRFTMSIHNPALTGQILVSAARAVVRQKPGCYTLIEIPPIDLLSGARDDLIARLV